MTKWIPASPRLLTQIHSIRSISSSLEDESPKTPILSAPSPTADATRFVEPLRTSPKNSSSTPLPRSREHPGANHEEENLRMRLRSAWIKREFSIDASDMSKYTL